MRTHTPDVNNSMKVIHSSHLLVRAANERRVPAFVATNGCHSLAKIALKVPPVGRNRSVVARTSRCGECISNVKCKPKHQISTMVVCGSYMFEYNLVLVRIWGKIYNKGGGNREGRGAFYV